MVAFSFFAVALFCSLVKSGTSWNETMPAVDTAKWFCENYQYANERKFTTEKVNKGSKPEEKGSVVYYCTLTFYTKSVDGEEAQKFCKYHYPAVLISAQFSKANNLRCKYEIQYLCAPGKIPIGDLCVEFSKEPLTLAAAKKKCEKQNGYLSDTKFGKEFVTQLINTANPRRFNVNVPKMWLLEEGKGYQVTLVRGLNSDLPGTRTPAKKTDTASYSCVYYGLKTYRIYEDECKIYKEQFKFAAAFHKGTCYTMSPSVQAKAKAHDLHQYCRWLSEGDHVVTPVSANRRDGLDQALAGTIFEYNWILTTGEKKKDIGGDADKNWKVADPDQSKDIDIFKGVWYKDRPVKESDGTQNLQAIVMPKIIRLKDIQGSLYDVPKYFRGHPVCALGITPNDNEFKRCDKDWKPVTRDDGRVMCVRAFHKELETKNYQESMDFCKQYGAVLAPMNGPEEQELIISLLGDRLGGAMWLGAKRRARFSKIWIWEIDGATTDTLAENWTGGEPNNLYNNEDCLQIYTGGVANRPRGKWNDINCNQREGSHGDGIFGGVCAKYHDLE